MLRLTTHIERLLLAHDCVIVPGLGGFVLQRIPAFYDSAKACFVPMRKEVVFNTTLQHNDGLLCESYMQAYQVSFQEAQRMMERDIEELKSVLYDEGRVSLGFMGSFSVGEEKQVVFEPNGPELMSVYSYGLGAFQMPTLAELQSPAQSVSGLDNGRKDVFYIPVSRRLLRTVAASVAAVSLFLLVSTPVRDVNPSAYKASFVPTEMVGYPSVVPVVENTRKAEVLEVETPREPLVPETPASEAKPAGKKEEAKPVPEQPDRKMYHLVIASFPDKKQADEFLGKVDRKACPRVSVIERGGKFRIYADRFDNREEAESSLEVLRKDARFKDAWLFISR